MTKKKDNKQIDIEEAILYEQVLSAVREKINSGLPSLLCVRAITMVNFRILNFIKNKKTREIIKNLLEQILINCNK